MKEKKSHMVGVKLNDTQVGIIDKMIADGQAKNRSEAIQKLITRKGITG